MVAIDGHIGTGVRPILNIKLRLAGFVGLAAAALTLAIMASHGFNEDGLRRGSEFSWRFASFVFAAAAMIGPVCRLIPLGICKSLGLQRRQLIWSFCISYGVFLASMILPNTLGGVTHEDATTGMTLFSLFGGGTAAVLAYATGRNAAARMERKRGVRCSVLPHPSSGSPIPLPVWRTFPARTGPMPFTASASA